MGEEYLLAQFEEYLVGIGMAPATIANYLADIRDLARWIEGLGVAEIGLLGVDTEHIRHYCLALHRQGRPASTINRRLQAVRKFYDFAVQASLSSANPARDVQRFDGQSTEPPRLLTAEEAGSLLRAVGECADSLARRDRAILLLLLETGIKASELVDLRTDDVMLDVGSGYVLVGQDLQSGGRCVSFGAEACAALRACMRLRAPAPGVEHLFISRQGQPLSVRSVQRLVSNYAHAAGLQDVSVHTLRYTFAHDVSQEVEDPSEVAQMLGLRDVGNVRRHLT